MKHTELVPNKIYEIMQEQYVGQYKVNHKGRLHHRQSPRHPWLICGLLYNTIAMLDFKEVEECDDRDVVFVCKRLEQYGRAKTSKGEWNAVATVAMNKEQASSLVDLLQKKFNL